MANLNYRNQRGQGTVEYVLLLVVVIAIAGAVLTQFFRPFNSWARNYIGAYIECLLDTGELPSLGGPGTTGECNDRFEEFSAFGGRSEKQDEGKSASTDEAASTRNKKRDRDGGAASGGIISDSRSRKSGINLQPRRRGTDGASGPTITATIPSDSAGGGYMRFRRPTIIYVTRKGDPMRGLAGMLNAEREKTKKREEKFAVSKREAEELGGSRPKKRMVTSATIKRPEKDDELGGYNFSFGAMLRWIIIIAIVGMLIFLVASQLNSISKSLEKG